MKASKSAYVLIHTFEGCRLHAYKCPAGVWTIGWGHTAGVYEGMTITREQANELLKKDVAIFEDHLNYALGLDDAGRMPNGLPISQHQFDALLSFTYNVGTGNLARSSTPSSPSPTTSAPATSPVPPCSARSRATRKILLSAANSPAGSMAAASAFPALSAGAGWSPTCTSRKKFVPLHPEV